MFWNHHLRTGSSGDVDDREVQEVELKLIVPVERCRVQTMLGALSRLQDLMERNVNNCEYVF